MGGGSETESGWWQDEKGKWRQSGGAKTSLAADALARRPRRVLELLGALILHAFGALTWFVSLGFSSDVGTDKQLDEALEIGAVTWLVAALLIGLLWWLGRPLFFWSIPFAWWLPSFLLAITVAYGWN